MKNNKIIDYLKKITETEASLRRIPVYFFIICVVLVLIFFQLIDMNKYLKTISENTGRNNAKETFIETEIEAEKTIEDFIPLLEEISKYEEENSTTIYYRDTENNGTEKETTTKKQSSTQSTQKETTTKNETITTTNNNSKTKNYVININSNKIHYADCTFADRTKEENKKSVKLTDSELNSYLSNGYTFCKTCGGN